MLIRLAARSDLISPLPLRRFQMDQTMLRIRVVSFKDAADHALNDIIFYVKKLIEPPESANKNAGKTMRVTEGMDQRHPLSSA